MERILQLKDYLDVHLGIIVKYMIQYLLGGRNEKINKDYGFGFSNYVI